MYYILDGNKKYEQGDVFSHLSYLNNKGGTLDFWDSEKILMDAMKAGQNHAKDIKGRTFVVDENNQVVWYSHDYSIQ